MDGEELGRVTLPAVPESMREARAFVAKVLEGHPVGSAIDSALVVVSELAANAMLHAETPFDVVVRTSGAGIRLEVHDRNSRLPRRKRYSDQATTGRGLVLVEALSAVAGAERTESGKVVWAVLSDVVAPPPKVGQSTDEADAGGPIAPSPVPGGAAPSAAPLQAAAHDDSWDVQAKLWAHELALAPA